MSWFRIHTSLRDNAKIQLLNPKDFKNLINLWCLAKDGDGVIPSVPEIAFKLRMTDQQVRKAIAALPQLIEPQADGTFRAHDWNEHQYQSDVSTNRVKQFRERQRNVSGNQLETPPEYRVQSTDTEEPPIAPAIAAEERLKDMGWVGVSKTPEDVCSAIAALRCDEFPESRALNSPFMIVCRLTWFDDFWAFYWRKDDKRKARIKYFEKVTTAKLQEEVENAVIAQAPEMLAREKQHRKLAATWLHGECWTNEPTLLDGDE